MNITVEDLERVGACPAYINTFKEKFPIEDFPEGVEVTEEVCLANVGQFDFQFAAQNFLTSDVYAEFATEFRTVADAEYTKNQEAQLELTAIYEMTSTEWREKWGNFTDRFTDAAQAEFHEFSAAYHTARAKVTFDRQGFVAQLFGKYAATQDEPAGRSTDTVDATSE